MLYSAPGLCHSASFIFLVEGKRRSQFSWYRVFGMFLVLFFFLTYIYSFWNYVERMQLADVSQGPVPMWLCSETTAQFQELSVLLDKSKSQTLDPCLVIVSKAESSLYWEPWTPPPWKGGSIYLTRQGRGERKHSWEQNWGTQLFCSRSLRKPTKEPGWASP